jgi:hypothetical protein
MLPSKSFLVHLSFYLSTHHSLATEKIVTLALTSPTSGCRSVGLVRSRTQATEFIIFTEKIVKESKEIRSNAINSRFSGASFLSW